MIEEERKGEEEKRKRRVRGEGRERAESGAGRSREAMALVGGQLTSVREMSSNAVLASANSGVATCFAGAAGNGGPLAAFKAGTHSFTKLPILPNIAFGEVFVPSSYNFGACSHAKVRARAQERARGSERRSF